MPRPFYHWKNTHKFSCRPSASAASRNLTPEVQPIAGSKTELSFITLQEAVAVKLGQKKCYGFAKQKKKFRPT
jgi:hypothetical protein